MKYRFYNTSEKAWQAMYLAILEAKSYIYLESYILFEDSLTKNLFQALKDKARVGIKVKIVVDQVGSFWISSLSLAECTAAGIEILFFRRFFIFNHRKVLIIDGKTAFIGGVNIHGKHAKWLDLHISLSDKFFIKNFLYSFIKVYQLAGGADLSVIDHLKKKKVTRRRFALYKTKVFLIEHGLFRRRSVLKKYYKKKIAESERSIVIVTPYFIPHRWLVKAIGSAVRRGVRVEVILPMKTDSAIADAANWISAEELGNRINFLFLPEMNHAKVLLVDGKEGMVGSNNIDARSFDLNLETGIVFQRKDMILDLEEILKKWRESATPYEKLPLWHPWYYQIVKFFIKLISPSL